MSKRTSTQDRLASQAMSGESTRSVAATVGWMLSTLATLVALLVVVALELTARLIDRGGPLIMISRLLLFTAAVSGIVTLVMLAVTWKVRDVRPPKSIVIGSLVIALAPWIGVAVIVSRP